MAETYEQRRKMLLIELRLIRRTKPAKRVVKHMQRLMRALRTYRRMMNEAKPADIAAIRSDARVAEIVGPEYGISGRHVRRIRRRELWRHVN